MPCSLEKITPIFKRSINKINLENANRHFLVTFKKKALQKAQSLFSLVQAYWIKFSKSSLQQSKFNFKIYLERKFSNKKSVFANNKKEKIFFLKKMKKIVKSFCNYVFLCYIKFVNKSLTL